MIKKSKDRAPAARGLETIDDTAALEALKGLCSFVAGVAAKPATDAAIRLLAEHWYSRCLQLLTKFHLYAAAVFTWSDAAEYGQEAAEFARIDVDAHSNELRAGARELCTLASMAAVQGVIDKPAAQVFEERAKAWREAVENFYGNASLWVLQDIRESEGDESEDIEDGQ